LGWVRIGRQSVGTLTHRSHLGRGGSDAAKLRADAKTGEAWQRSELTDVTAKVVIYEAFVEGNLEAPRYLARTVHDPYFEPRYEEFRPRTIWSLSNAFTSAFKELDPIPQFKATAKLGEFPEDRFLTVVLTRGRLRSAPAPAKLYRRGATFLVASGAQV
jgi:hypothetical protein